MQYTEEQLIEIRKRVEMLEERMLKLDRAESESLRERMIISRELTDLTLLLSGKPIRENSEDVIGLGSKFRAILKSDGFEEEEIDFIISESAIKAPGFFTVTINSPLGKNALGKKVGDSFTYATENISNECTIKEIYKLTKEQPKQKTIEK